MKSLTLPATWREYLETPFVRRQSETRPLTYSQEATIQDFLRRKHEDSPDMRLK